MALSPQDKEFYEEKLSMKSFGYVACATAGVGAVGFPLLFFVQDCSQGLSGRWTFNVAFEWSIIGFMIGFLVSFFLYLFFKFLLEMGWLPSRR